MPDGSHFGSRRRSSFPYAWAARPYVEPRAFRQPQGDLLGEARQERERRVGREHFADVLPAECAAVVLLHVIVRRPSVFLDGHGRSRKTEDRAADGALAGDPRSPGWRILRSA